MDTPSSQRNELQLVAPAKNRANKAGAEVRRSSLECYHISPRMAQEIADEARLVRSSRVIARKYGIPQHVVSDCLDFFPPRRPVAMESSLTPVVAFRRRA